MKKFILVFSLASLAGCAHQGTSKTDKAALDSPYLKGVSSQSLRASGGAQSCPKSPAVLKGQSWKTLLGMGNACVRTAQWTMVEKLGTQLAQEEHMAPWGAYYLSLAAEARGDLPRAVWMAELGLKKAPESSLLVYQQGRLLWRAGDQSNAVKAITRAAALDPMLSDAQLLLGQLALQNQKWPEASQRLTRVLEQEPRLLSALLGLAEASSKMGDHKRSGDLLAEAVLHHPFSYRARLRQAQLWEIVDQNLAEALGAYRRIQALARQNKLDDSVDVNLDEKIRVLEAANQAAPKNQVTLREPTQERKESK